MNLDTSAWKEFRIGDLFRIQRGQTLKAEDKEEYLGEIPCINGSSENNGVICKLSAEIKMNIVKAPFISIVRVGEGGKTFVQTENSYIADNAFALIPKECLSTNSLLFVSSVLDCECLKYSYGRTVTNAYVNTIIQLPATPSDEPDWQYMEDYIKSLHHKPLTTKNKAGQAPELNVKEWEDYNVSEIFEITNCVSHDLGNLEEGHVRFIGRTALNNGLQGFVDVAPEDINDGNCITISRVATNVALWQDELFTTSQHITTLRNSNMNKQSGIFICTILNMEMEGKFSYGRTIGKDDINKMIIKLPMDKNGYPDWQWMEDYIKALPYGDRL